MTEVQLESPAKPGSRLALEAGQGNTVGTRFRWVQIEGPAVEIQSPDRPSVAVTIPDGTDRLAFLLIAATSRSVKAVRVEVPVQRSSSSSSWASRPSGKVKADAGDDQVGLVGHRVTLNGSRSRPIELANSRWLQVEGPPAGTPQQTGPFFSFVPPAPGLYRFWLIVAGDGEVSEPDEVSVMVGTPPVAAHSSAASPVGSPSTGSVASGPTPEQLLTTAVSRLPDAARVCSEVSDVMESISERTALYESFGMLQAELTRRLDVVIPSDPAARNSWTEAVFAPLTTFTANQLLAAGLDMRVQQTLTQPLSAEQKARIHDYFQGLARAFRVVAAAR